jgi:predicted SAM-dependent methyltransferase
VAAPDRTLSPDEARALLRECVTVVRPGETLVIRVPPSWTAYQVQEYQEYADAAGLPFRVLVVMGDELAVAERV